MKQLKILIVKSSLLFIIALSCSAPKKQADYSVATYPFDKDSLETFINRNILWPDNMISGPFKIYVECEIDENGKLVNTKVVKKVYDKFDNEALRVINLIKTWSPAIKEGKNVKSTIIVPVEFKLE